MVAPAYGPPPVKCFRCGTSGVWHPQANAWGCDRCRQLIGGPPQFPAPGGAQAFTPGPPAAAPAPVAPQCTRCWGPTVWKPEAQRFGCDRCQLLVDPAQAQAAQNAQAVGDSGVKVMKFIIWLVVLIALIALRVALRSGRW